jgi:hypothetical protein
VTIGAFEDLGYSVDYERADAYRLPTARELREFLAARETRGHDCVIEVPEQRVLPESALARRDGGAAAAPRRPPSP